MSHGSFGPFQNGSLVGLFCSMKSDQIEEPGKRLRNQKEQSNSLDNLSADLTFLRDPLILNSMSFL